MVAGSIENVIGDALGLPGIVDAIGPIKVVWVVAIVGRLLLRLLGC